MYDAHIVCNLSLKAATYGCVDGYRNLLQLEVGDAHVEAQKERENVRSLSGSRTPLSRGHSSDRRVY